MSDPSPFTEGYYLRAEGSNYRDYQWLPDQTIPLAAAIKKLMGMQDGDTVLDVGAARGYLVKAFRILGLKAFGYDVSEWAVENCDPDVYGVMSTSYDVAPMSYDFITLKDVTEHIEPVLLRKMMLDFTCMTRKAILVIVPLTAVDGGEYLCPHDECDTTHVNRWSLPTWISFLENIDRRMVVSGGYYAPGIKQKNTAWEKSCGIITIRRV